eukprot:gnl/TRDRNA2_/TRDRNA2_45280_c0_seq1.p1 gnl/TRDRNA2_/TRDRNA2_45280_c0~~gnl/TRDRNA2_/TRDRNA2_45280_c0_seq1.p1  ORF type:complete len:611 (-),score=127.91 gnl/TRDRNA2_/TRDRNA2_45280_c0_seq1:29-1861(-)
MTIYYDPQEPIFCSLFRWKNTTFRVVLTKPEFWAYMGIHLFQVTAIQYLDLELDVKWEAASMLQFFMTFVLTFYNEHCYERYTKFYMACMDMMDCSMLFAQELTISMQYEQVERHRLAAQRYILTAVYLFYMSLTGGMPMGMEWKEVKRKGLLTKGEEQMLHDYPGGRVTLILTSWALQTISDALTSDPFWHERAMQIAHVHNRINAHVRGMVKAVHRIGFLLALPIPYPYFHLMNVIMVLNFLIMSMALASFKTYATVVPYGFALLIFMVLRELAIALSDPFGQDDVDFPIAIFLEYTFDHSIGILEAFSHPLAYQRTQKQIKHAVPFTDEQMMRICSQKILYDPNYRPAKDNPFAWNKTMPFSQIAKSKQSVKKTLNYALAKFDNDTLGDIRKDKEKEKEEKASQSEDDAASHATSLTAPVSPYVGNSYMTDQAEVEIQRMQAADMGAVSRSFADLNKEDRARAEAILHEQKICAQLRETLARRHEMHMGMSNPEAVEQRQKIQERIVAGNKSEKDRALENAVPDLEAQMEADSDDGRRQRKFKDTGTFDDARQKILMALEDSQQQQEDVMMNELRQRTNKKGGKHETQAGAAWQSLTAKQRQPRGYQ